MAVAKKKEKGGGGAPEWMVTYGDMVTLLLTFFVLLLSMSEIKKDEKLIEFMKAIREAFGYQGNMQPLPMDTTQPPKVVPWTEIPSPVSNKDMGKSQTESIQGRDTTVRPISANDMFIVGAPIRFRELSDEPLPGEEEYVEQLAKILSNSYARVEIRAHCSYKPVDGTPYKDHYDLTYARARRIRDMFIERGIGADRLALVQLGTTEPLKVHAYSPQELAKNDIVEIIQLSDGVKGPGAER